MFIGFPFVVSRAGTLTFWLVCGAGYSPALVPYSKSARLVPAGSPDTWLRRTRRHTRRRRRVRRRLDQGHVW